jgi:hypothetical protein
MANLPTSLFEDLAQVNLLENLPPGSQRSAPRFPYHEEAVVSLPGKGKNQITEDVKVRDISLGGISFVGELALKPGSKFSMWLTRRRGTIVCLECYVEHCRKLTGDDIKGFLVGASFVRILQAETAKA